MKHLLTLVFIIVTSSAMAHEVQTLGQGIFHLAYHVVFWGLFALVAHKAFDWCKKRIKSKI